MTRCSFLALVSVVAPVAAQEPVGGAKVYRDAVPSVVWVHSTRPGGLATGSGALIDRDRRLILTNYHVVEENPKATVFFPEFRDGQPVPEKSYYSARTGRLGIPGRVLALDKSADLALIRIDSVPDGVKAIPLAPTSPTPGDGVHSIGNAGDSGALWGYVKGTVRQVYHKEWNAKLVPGRVVRFKAKVVETDSATNHGDSGGPLLNDKGELVGVTEGGAVNANLISTFVDVSEVKQMLGTRAVRDVPVPKVKSPPVVADSAKLFSADAVKKANEVLADLRKRGLDVLVETYPAAPKEWVEKAKGSADERRKLFQEWAADRLRTEDVRGFAVLVCLDPRYVAVEVPEDVKGKLPEGFATKVGDAMIAALREKKADAGLTGVLKLAADGWKGDRK